MSYRHVIWKASSALPALWGNAIGGTHVAVASEVLQQLDLSQRPLGQDLLAEHIGDLLDGDAFTRLHVRSGTAYGALWSACWFPRGSDEKTKESGSFHGLTTVTIAIGTGTHAIVWIA